MKAKMTCSLSINGKQRTVTFNLKSIDEMDMNTDIQKGTLVCFFYEWPDPFPFALVKGRWEGFEDGKIILISLDGYHIIGFPLEKMQSRIIGIPVRKKYHGQKNFT